MMTKVDFEKALLCNFKVAASGKKAEELSDDLKKSFTEQSCAHKAWPPFMPQCKECLKNNNHSLNYVDKKGRIYRKVG